MQGAIADRRAMIAGMTPALRPDPVAWTVPDRVPLPMGDARIIAMIHEAEGPTLILPAPEAEALGLPVVFLSAQITLTVHSALEGVGLTAAVATALADAGIPCNVVAGARHDHLFVPWDDRAAAMAALVAVQAAARGDA
jgi:hypothetical protein